MQSKRSFMEEKCSMISLKIFGLDNRSFFAIFDGHGPNHGDYVCNYLSIDLIKSILTSNLDHLKYLAQNNYEVDRIRNTIGKALIDLNKTLYDKLLNDKNLNKFKKF